jgi:hypothetical protein
MLRAVSEPDAPYLLVLDEMNLAHVEDDGFAWPHRVGLKWLHFAVG